MTDLQKKAVALHTGGSGCTQAVFCAFADVIGFDFATAHRFATGLGGGMGRCQLVCGAITGGILALGAAFGNNSGADLDAKELSYAKASVLVKTVEKEYGCNDCQNLLGIDISTEEGRARVKEEGLADEVCDKLIARVVELVYTELEAGGFIK